MTNENKAEQNGFAALGITGALLKATLAAGFWPVGLGAHHRDHEFANRPAGRLMEAIGMRDEGSGRYYGRDSPLYVAERAARVRSAPPRRDANSVSERERLSPLQSSA